MSPCPSNPDQLHLTCEALEGMARDFAAAGGGARPVIMFPDNLLAVSSVLACVAAMCRCELDPAVGRLLIEGSQPQARPVLVANDDRARL